MRFVSATAEAKKRKNANGWENGRRGAVGRDRAPEAARAHRVRKRDRRDEREHRRDRQDWRDREEQTVRLRRHEVFLREELQPVGGRMQKPSESNLFSE